MVTTKARWKFLRKSLVLVSLVFCVGAHANAEQGTSPCPPAPDASSETLKRLAQTEQPDRGPLWEVTKDGRRSFLYGTVHVAKLEWDFPGPAIKAALNSASHVAVEVDLTDPTLAERLEPKRTGTKPSHDPGHSARAARISKLFRQGCLDESRFSGASSRSKMTSLSLLSARGEGLYPDFAIDSALVGYARVTGKKVVELETAEEQRTALSGSPVSRETANAQLDAVIARLENGDEKRVLIRLVSAWAAGDLAEIERYFFWCDCTEAEMDGLIGQQRNTVLAERIARLYEKQNNVFAAVGVLHLIGKSSVLNQLKKMGYSIQQVAANR